MKLFTFLAFLSLLLSGCVVKNSGASAIPTKPMPVKTVAKTAPIKPIQTKTEVAVQAPIKQQKTPTQRATVKTPTLAPVTVAERASAMSLKTLNGGVIKVNASGYNMEFLSPKYRGQNVMFFLFGHDCPHCKVEIPTVKELSLNPNLKIIGIHAKSMIGDGALKRFVRNNGLNFDVLSFSDDIKMIRFLKDNDFYDGNVPSNILVHRDGTIEIVTVANVLGKI